MTFLELITLLLLGAMVCASIGYVYGAKLTPELGAEQVICWVCLGALPVTLPLALWLWPADAAEIRPAAWAGFVASSRNPFHALLMCAGELTLRKRVKPGCMRFSSTPMAWSLERRSSISERIA